LNFAGEFGIGYAVDGGAIFLPNRHRKNEAAGYGRAS
jgi:hypothetical protein